MMASQMQTIAPDCGRKGTPSSFSLWFHLPLVVLSHLVTCHPLEIMMSAAQVQPPARGLPGAWPSSPLWFGSSTVRPVQPAHRRNLLSGRTAGVLSRRSWQKKPRSLLSSRSTVSAGLLGHAGPQPANSQAGPWGSCSGLRVPQWLLSLPLLPSVLWPGAPGSLCWAALTPAPLQAPPARLARRPSSLPVGGAWGSLSIHCPLPCPPEPSVPNETPAPNGQGSMTPQTLLGSSAPPLLLGSFPPMLVLHSSLNPK